MNQLLEHENFVNRYWVLRHGHSEANQQGLIVSAPENGIGAFGLSARGRTEVESSLEACAGIGAECRIVSSDFLRTLETARIAQARLSCATSIETDPRLRERFFGDFELQPNDAYAQVWREDAVDPDSEFSRVESANGVMRRVTSLILDLETQFEGQRFLLVSHGDALQLLLTAFARRDASRHRDIAHLATAEIRELLPG